MEGEHKKPSNSEPSATSMARPYHEPNTSSPNIEEESNPTTQTPPFADSNDEDSTRKKLPTVSEAIGWLQEHALRHGEVGFSYGNYLTAADIFKDQSFDYSAGPYSSDDDVVSAMEQLHDTIVRERQQQETIANNKPLLKNILLELDRRILALSSNHEQTKFVLAKASLPRKVQILYKYEHPAPVLPKDSVIGWVSLKPLINRKVRVNLPIKASIDEVYSLLECLLKTWQARTNDNELESTCEEEIVWKYRVVLGTAPMYDKPAEPLSSDTGYRMMIDDILRKRIPRQTSVLLEMERVRAESGGIKEGSGDPIDHYKMGQAKGSNIEGSASKVCKSTKNSFNLLLINFQENSPENVTVLFDDIDDRDFADDNPLDDDGNPYFDEGPIDWDKVYSNPNNWEICFPELVDELTVQEKQSRPLVAEPDLFPNYEAAQGKEESSPVAEHETNFPKYAGTLEKQRSILVAERDVFPEYMGSREKQQRSLATERDLFPHYAGAQGQGRQRSPPTAQRELFPNCAGARGKQQSPPAKEQEKTSKYDLRSRR